MFKGKSVYLIDTPGLKDSEGVDKENIKNTVQFLKDHQYGLHGIVFVLNGQDPRIDSTDKDLIRLLCNIFNADEFWEHMCILFTRCINHPSVMFNESERRTDYDRKIREIAKEMQIELPDGEIQAFFVDLKDSSNQKSIQNIENLKDWLLQLGPIGRMDQMKAADNKIKNTDVEKRPRLTHSEKLYEKKRRGGIAGLFGGSHMRCHATRDWYVDEEREVQTQYDGTISYGEWKTTRTWYEDRA
uniref:AIG1-type G domain-containing protein n=1 Tax=Plectus sambesii TaxID=2011161 RepID=A0A914WTD4_9BILA